MKKTIASAMLVTLGAILPACMGTADGNATDPTNDVSGNAVVGGLQFRGVNLASAEFGMDAFGGGSGNYVYPDPTYVPGYTSADYFIGKGMNIFRLPFRWEHLQPNRGQAFDASELDKLRTTVNHLTQKGAFVLIDPHNYARFFTNVIGAGVSNGEFADLWSRLADEFKGNDHVIFGLMNEPHDIATEAWVDAANAAIGSIRNTGAKNLILVPGNGWTGAHSWSESWYGTANAQALLKINDPGNNVAFEAHQYLDSDSSGTNAACSGPNVGSQRMQPFTDWLKANGKKGFLGEFGGGGDGTCSAAIDDIVTHLEQNRDVYLGFTFWAAGPWWGDYFTSLEPNGGDKPQMKALLPHLTGGNGGGSTGGGSTGGSSGGFDGTGFYKITALHTGMALDVPNGSPDNGTPIQQWDYWGGDMQKWRIAPVGDGSFRVSVKSSGKDLDVSGISQDNGARVHEWDDLNGANQHWNIESTGPGTFKLIAHHSGKALDVGGNTRGALLQQWDYGGGANQQFRIERVE